MDELAHLAAGLSHWKFGNFDLYRVNPPLPRMIASAPLLLATPMTNWSAFEETPFRRPEFAVGRAFQRVNGRKAFWYISAGRMVAIPFLLFGGMVIFRWSAELYGYHSGLTSLCLWCFSPNLLAWGAQITPDALGASAGIFAGWRFWHWIRHPGWKNASYAASGMLLSLLCKNTFLFLIPIWIVLAIIRRPQGTSRARIGCQLAFMIGTSVYGINLAYGFENTLKPLGEYSFISTSLGGGQAHECGGNRFSKGPLGRLPIPFPQNYVLGIDVQKYDFERGKVSYLWGTQQHGGWWYYYLAGILLKTPLPWLALYAVVFLVAVKLGSRQVM